MNDVNIIGYINSKPSMKQKDERTVVNFLISPRHRKDTPVEFIPCVVFGKYAESVYPYIHKGDMSLSELLRYHPEAMEYVDNHRKSLEEDFNNGKVGKR